MMKMIKSLAPCGHYLQSQIFRGSIQEVVIIFMGKFSLERSLDFQDVLPYTLCLPPSTSPADYIWPLTNSEVYLVDTGSSSFSFIRFCALCFFSYGAKLVRYISASQSFVIEKGLSHE